jgi:hypothetical protein
MDRPFALLCDWYYKWILDQTNPYGASDLGLEYVPTNQWTPWGPSINLAWYRDLALKTGLSSKPDLVKVNPARPIPASLHNYNNELDNVRKSAEGVSAFLENSVNIEGYEKLKAAELNCFENMRKGIDFKSRSKLALTDSKCRLPRRLYHDTTNNIVEDQRAKVVSCMTKHSVEHGDGDRQAFDACLEEYTQGLIKNGTSREALNKLAEAFVELFEPGAIEITRQD